MEMAIIVNSWIDVSESYFTIFLTLDFHRVDVLVTFVGPELHEIFGLSVIIINLNE
jgi:hypothetical protein